MAPYLVALAAFATIATVCASSSQNGTSPLAALPVEYPHFPYRTVRLLDGRWSFAWLGSNVTDATTLSPTSITTNHTIAVPSCFDLMTWDNENLAGQHGTALYRTQVVVTPNTLGRIRFGACGFYCAVYIDGVKVGEHGGNGYTPFWVGGIPPSPSPVRTVEVISDNRFNATTAVLHAYDIDWYQYGGIYRSVEWHELPPVALQHAHVLVTDAPSGAFDLRLHVHDLSETSKLPTLSAGHSMYAKRHRGYGGSAMPALPSWIVVNVTVDATPLGTFNASVDADGVALIPGLTVPQPTLWSTSSPVMHSLVVALQSSSTAGAAPASEVLLERFGLRTVSVCSPYGNATAVICINGSPVKLLGYGRHDTHAHFGHAIGGMQRTQDIAIMQALGSNYARIGHYTQERSMQSLSDDAGLLNGVEMIAWDASPAIYTNPAYIAAGLAGMEEMVNDTFNHPSTIMYYYFNEGASNNASNCVTYALFNARYKALQVQGLTIYASDRGVDDVCFGPSGVDVLGFNDYPGWYESTTDIDANVQMVTQALDSLATWAAQAHPGKPILMTEIGAGAIPGWDDAMHGVWTATYQARILDAATRGVVYDDRWSGVALWQLMDQRTFVVGSGALGRPRGFNNKGTFDENRKPKLAAYSVVYNAFHGLPQPDWLSVTLP